MNRPFSADALGGDGSLGRLPQARAERRAFGAKCVLPNAILDCQQTGSISWAVAVVIGRSQGCRWAMFDMVVEVITETTEASQRVERNPVVSVFFSSRRRHTRFDCDWSSDVCSSD